MTSSKWTTQAIIEEAQKHDSMSALARATSSAYHAALKNKSALQEINKIFNEKKVLQKKYWTKNRIRTKSNEYASSGKSKTKFYSDFPVAKTVVEELGLTEEVSSRFRNAKRRMPKGFWQTDDAKDYLREIVKNYETRSDFAKYASNAYQAAIALNMLDELFSDVDSPIKHKNYWTRERVAEAVKGYTRLVAFRTEQSSAFQAAQRNGWTDLIEHLEKSRSNSQWTPARLAEEVKKYSDIREFRLRNTSAYLAAKRQNVFDELTKNMTVKKRRPRGYWQSLDNILTEAKAYETMQAFINEYPAVKRICEKNGWETDLQKAFS